MSLIPKTTCGRCHRQYAATRGSCPYCGEKKPREARRTVPEADSAVRGTAASARAAESLNWQMLFGTVLVIAVLAAVIVIVSIGVGNNMAETAEVETQVPGQRVEADNIPSAAATAVPTPTMAPTPVPTPTPQVLSISITCWDADMPGFTQRVGDEVQLDMLIFPIDSDAEITWSSTDESVAVVDQTGLVTLVGPGNCYIKVSAGGLEDSCQVISLSR